MSFHERLHAALTAICNLNILKEDIPIGLENISLDSRAVSSKTVFVAMQGLNAHGKNYLPDAIERGMQLAIIENTENEHDSVKKIANTTLIHIGELSKKLAQLMFILYPQINNIKHLVAATGTNGKTSVTNMYAQLASAMGFNAASIGTLGVYIYAPNTEAKKLNETINTTPDPIKMLSTLAELADRNVEYVSIEASSHGIEQGRLNALPIDTVVFTNLTQDHLDYHKSMAAYAAAKRSILNNKNIKHLVYNADDIESANWLKALDNEIDTIGFSTQDDKADLFAKQIEYAQRGLRFKLCLKRENHQIELPLLGQFNVYNYLAVIGCFLHQGINIEDLKVASDVIAGVNGRMELMHVGDKTVLVDYAHTPDALMQALTSAKRHANGNLWVVFGCGGDRDKAKRAKMGSISSQLADKIVLTQDNPRSESPDAIIADILSGMKRKKPIKIENERATAVRYALNNAESGDIILLAGKGHETYIEVDGQKDFYDERALVKTLAEEYV